MMLRIARNLCIVLATAVASIAIVYFSIPMSNTSQSNFDVIVVLGGPMRSDGSISAVTRSRVLEATRQYRARVAPRLIMSGGPTHNRFIEAEGMARFAELQGVPASAIFLEGQSLDTIQNAYYSYRIMQEHGWQSALIVSSASHLRRASLIFRYYPIAWRMQAAPWPTDASARLWLRMWFAETVYTTYLRLFGFPGSPQYLPRTPLTPPHL
jgi:uncharacterized SAM-binding protein YcdF (DUF218 family)